MKIEQITAKDFKDAVDWLLKENQGCVHKVLATTDEGTQLCFVVGWSKASDFGGDDAKYGYVDDGYYIAAKIGYQHRNNGMQSDFDWDFNMPYDTETGDVWDTSSYVPRDADWEREAADYTSVAEKIWAAYGDPEDKKFWDDNKAPLDLMESKKHTCSTQKKKESIAAKKSEAEGLDNLVGIKDVKEIQKQIDSLGLTFVESGDYAGHIWGYAVYKSPKGEYLQYDYNGTNDACRSVKVYKSKQDFIDAEGYDPEKSESKKSEAKKHTCSMQKKKESLTAKKSEAASDTIRVTDEDVMLTVNEVDVDEHGGSFSVDTPEKGKSYDLREMKDMVKGMCEDCSGYSDISRDGSDVRIAVKAPESDKGGEFNGDYYDAFVMRCTARIVHVSLEGVVDYLAED